MRRVAALAVLAGAAAAIALGLRGRGGDTLPPVASAREWVPFRAEFRQLRGGTPTATGRYFRNQSGSARRETTVTASGHRFVTIENVATGRFYSFADGRWSAQPLRLRAPRLPPGPTSKRHLMELPERVEGLRLVRETTRMGAVLLRAPALDLFPIVERHPDPAMHREHFHVVVGPVDDSVFAPPPGASVDELPWPHELP